MRRALRNGKKRLLILNKNSIRNVTNEYVKTKNAKINLDQGMPDSTTYAYICVFNSGEWKAISAGRPYSTTVVFPRMGMGIAYLPAFYYKEEIIPAGNAFILSDSGNVEYKIPDGNKRIEVKLFLQQKGLPKKQLILWRKPLLILEMNTSCIIGMTNGLRLEKRLLVRDHLFLRIFHQMQSIGWLKKIREKKSGYLPLMRMVNRFGGRKFFDS